MLKREVIPNLSDQPTARFGQRGKMIIKGLEIAEEDKERCKKIIQSNVKITCEGCWEWTGRTHNGYAHFIGFKSTMWAHRVSYAVYVGPIAEQMHIDHKCRNRSCVNPAHLKQVTPVENYEAIYRRKLRDERKALEEAGQLTLW